MQKRVHFAPTNTVFSPIPTTPSPSLSEASLPSDSSSELSTPPPEIDYSPAHDSRSPFPHPTDLIVHPHHQQLFHPQAYPQHPAPQPQPQPQLQDVILKPILEPGHLQIHYLLAYSPVADIPIHFDLSLHWSQIQSQIPAHELSEAATNPPMTSMVITTPLLPWELHIKPRVPGSHVTVMDILYCLFRQLRFAVTREEYETTAGAARVAVDSAYHARCARVADPHARATEEAKGVKKVDFLQGRNIFKGLSATLASGHVLELNVASAGPYLS